MFLLDPKDPKKEMHSGLHSGLLIHHQPEERKNKKGESPNFVPRIETGDRGPWVDREAEEDGVEFPATKEFVRFLQRGPEYWTLGRQARMFMERRNRAGEKSPVRDGRS